MINRIGFKRHFPNSESVQLWNFLVQYSVTLQSQLMTFYWLYTQGVLKVHGEGVFFFFNSHTPRIWSHPSRHFWDRREWKSRLSIVIWECGRWKSGPCLLGSMSLWQSNWYMVMVIFGSKPEGNCLCCTLQAEPLIPTAMHQTLNLGLWSWPLPYPHKNS